MNCSPLHIETLYVMYTNVTVHLQTDALLYSQGIAISSIETLCYVH